MTEPCDLSAVEARRLIGRKALSPVELTDSCIARIEAVDGAVNAMVTRCIERAREEAKAAEKAVSRGDELGVLHGLPMGVKDLNVTEGVLTTYGSPIHAENVPAQDERIIAALRRAGAIVIGKTNTPEFGAGANTKNAVFGATGNPFDPKRICGGSSGGSAVALATGMAPICTGSDTGGSLRTPASFCGVVSHRGTPGLVPSDKRGIGLTTYNVQGPMARNVADTSLMLAAMAGNDPCDPLSGPVDANSFVEVEEVDLSQLRVAWSTDLGCVPVDNEIARIFEERVGKIASSLKAANAASRIWRGRSMYFGSFEVLVSWPGGWMPIAIRRAIRSERDQQRRSGFEDDGRRNRLGKCGTDGDLSPLPKLLRRCRCSALSWECRAAVPGRATLLRRNQR